MKQNKINLIFYLPNFSQGGAGKSILQLCNLLNKNLFKITIISIGKCYYKNSFNENVKFFQIPKKKIFFSFFDIMEILKNYKKNNTIFISNINYTNTLSCLFIKLILNYKLILIERTPLKELETFYNYKDLFKKKIIYHLMKFFYRFADKVIVNSLYTKRIFEKKIKCNLKLIYSPSIDKIELNKRNKIKDILKIITIGRLSHEKRHDFLINAISHINNIKVKVIILGNGPLKKKLNQIIKTKKISKKISIKSYNNKSSKLLNWSNLYINTSDFEGFPNSVVEAVNKNKFILSRNSGGGINDIIFHSSIGKIIEKDRPEVLAKEIINFFTNKNKKKISKNIISKKFSNFLAKNVTKEYNKIFLNL